MPSSLRALLQSATMQPPGLVADEGSRRNGSPHLSGEADGSAHAEGETGAPPPGGIPAGAPSATVVVILAAQVSATHVSERLPDAFRSILVPQNSFGPLLVGPGVRPPDDHERWNAIHTGFVLEVPAVASPRVR